MGPNQVDIPNAACNDAQIWERYSFDRRSRRPPTEQNQARLIYLEEVLNGAAVRGGRQDVTYSERGNIQGAQFHAVAGAIYEAAVSKSLGRDLPTEWFLQDIRD